MIRLASKLSLKLSEHAVLRFITKHPGRQLFEINRATLKSHHSWGTKSVLADLERRGKITVLRERYVLDGTFLVRKKIKPLYFAC